ncbi:hypothetical protein L1987_26422 [Smallanthus sonchifolius]|uniref:Uncharacterized protein n=1 Tax=Smallanthus sonchifolius TaxID=185202 RepID=A0ACB9IC89_9ASTR|nr:hypothetical protein L1987_26422 [Smallanthus sonchifolius]
MDTKKKGEKQMRIEEEEEQEFVDIEIVETKFVVCGKESSKEQGIMEGFEFVQATLSVSLSCQFRFLVRFVFLIVSLFSQFRYQSFSLSCQAKLVFASVSDTSLCFVFVFILNTSPSNSIFEVAIGKSQKMVRSSYSDSPDLTSLPMVWTNL